MLAAASPVLSLNPGSSGLTTFPDETRSKQGFLILQSEFTAGLVAPAEIVIDGAAESEVVQAGIERLIESMGADDIYGEARIQANAAGDLTLVSVPINADQYSNVGIGAARRI